MALIRELEKQEMTQISHRIPSTVAKRYQTLLERSKKMRVNLPASFAQHFTSWLDEVEAELNTMNVSKLRTPAKAED
jgi:hypothetical protein